MKQIQTWIVNPEALDASHKMTAFAARLTQRGEVLSTLDDVKALYEKPASDAFIKAMGDLPHPTLQKLGLINVVVVGASRRFLGQITRHQNDVHFMSGSLQYSDYADYDQFCVPYAIYEMDAQHPEAADWDTDLSIPDTGGYYERNYLRTCKEAMHAYTKAREQGLDNDACGYMTPQGLRNVLIISALPYQWKHMIHQRICRRNTAETRYVFLRIWEQLYALHPEMFPAEQCGAFCQQGKCQEGKMACGISITQKTPTEILCADFPLIMFAKEDNKC